MKRLSLHEWIPMLPWPVCPLAGHAKFGQNVVVGSMLVLRGALGNVPRGVCLDPHFHCKRTIPRLSVELPTVQYSAISPLRRTFIKPERNAVSLIKTSSPALKKVHIPTTTPAVKPFLNVSVSF